MSGPLTLVSHHLCPYVQRAAIALAEKAVPFERLYVDLANKPTWFQAISPLGKVPLLKVEPADGDPVVIFESAVILEFLEETQQNPLHPRDAYARARHRAWIEFGSATLNAIGRFYSAPTGADLRQEAMALSAMFERIEEELASRAQQPGPWFGGDAFSLVDAVWAPIFRYFDMFDEIGDFGILGGKPHLERWRAALSQRPSVRAAVSPDYPQRLRAFLRAKRSHLSERLLAADLAMVPA
ncbi:glutathione S-transferase family protein [Mesorhizobium sp. ANAO-SY3R2]|uniref:glutathione S-transferase family protein n=1 Tax=Mesorhizobium sp. ANAO-SY3R2 TaxID=3166644 RepID=UPI0036725DEB